jgi:hypothetical protein
MGLLETVDVDIEVAVAVAVAVVAVADMTGTNGRKPKADMTTLEIVVGLDTTAGRTN